MCKVCTHNHSSHSVIECYTCSLWCVCWWTQLHFKKYLLKLVDDIDAGNSNISDSEAIELVDTLKRLTDKEKRMSKYAAWRYLNMSRATFDNYVRTGKLPKGKHEIGFKELSYSKKDLDEFIKKYKQGWNVRLIW